MTSATTAAQPAPLPGDRAQHGARQPLSGSERWGAVFEYLLTVYKRTWRGSIIGRFLSPLFFLLSMGVGLGTLVDDRAGGVDGTPYLQFVVPAIVATQAMWVAMGESTYQVLGYIKWNMGYHAMLATPLGVRDILVGHLLSVVGHLSVATTIFMAVAALFGGFSSWWALLSLPIAVLTGMAFTVPIFAFTARQEGDSGFNILFRWIMTPLMLFSGTFFPVDQLPAVLQPIAYVTPLWHGVDACRDLALGQASLLGVLGHVAYLLLWVAGGFLVARWSFRTKLVV
jgi:lipooligosaccharide transport system permease protein